MAVRGESHESKDFIRKMGSLDMLRSYRKRISSEKETAGTHREGGI